MSDEQKKTDTVRIRCPYCQKVFSCRKQAGLEGKERVSVACPYCGATTLVPAASLKA